MPRRPRRVEWYEVLRQCRVSLLSVAVITAAFVWVPQAQDVLRALAEPGAGLWLFELLLLIWAMTVWHGARFLLDQDFEAMRANGARKARAGDLWGELFMPRMLGALGFIGIGVAMVRAVQGIPRDPGTFYDVLEALGHLNILAGVGFYYLMAYRRSASDWVVAKVRSCVPMCALDGLSFARRSVKIASLREFPSWLLWGLGGGFVVSVGCWLGLLFKLQTLSPWFGAGSTLLLGCIFLTIFGTVLIWLGERWKLPMLILVAMYLGLVSIFNDNHGVRTLDQPLPPSTGLTAARLYDGWLAQMDVRYGTAQPHPMFVVAASGGGIRAGYWTASVLARLQEADPRFADHTVVLSAVSGGALGALVFANVTADPTTPRDGHVDRVQAILSRDFLAPALSALMFIDLPARFWPIPDQFPDRAEALEVAWERAWLPQDGRDAQQSPFARGFAGLLDAERSHRVPMLLINGTSVYSGQRLLTTHLDLGQDFPDCLNVFDLLGQDIRMSTAAMMSARFTYVSPAGRLGSETAIVDGGYFENSGATTALQFYEAIRDRIDPARVTPYFVQIDNDYVATYDTQRSAGQAGAVRREQAQSWRIFPGTQAPIVALLNTRNAHAVNSNERVRSVFGERYFHYTFTAPEDVKAPLGWFLSQAAQRGLQRQLTSGSAWQTTEEIRRRLVLGRSRDGAN